MRLRFGVALSSALVVTIGIITLLGLLVGDDLGAFSTLIKATPIPLLSVLFVEIAVVTVALTVLIGVANLLVVHVRRIIAKKGVAKKDITPRLNSLVLLVAFLGTLVVAMNDSATSRILLEDVQIAGESALGALLFFTLVWGAMQVLRREVSFPRVLFIMTTLIVLVSALPISELAPLRQIGDWLYAVPVNAGARGILLGIGLATLVTGLRVLIGQDRSYGE